MSPGYFHFIIQQHSRIRSARNVCWPDLSGGLLSRIVSINTDVEMLKMFCKWLETCEYSKDLSLILEQLATHPTNQLYDGSTSLESITSLESAISDLEGMIVQSKQLIQGWCLNMMMQYKSSLFQHRPHFVFEISENLSKIHNMHYIRNRSPEIHVLDTNIKFLESALRQVNMGSLDLDGEQNLPFMNFAGNYANYGAWLTYLYWAKGDQDNEFASEIFFDTSHKFIPCAYDIIPFFAYNISFDTVDAHLESDFFRIGQVVERLVDFFFHHLAELLGYDFIFLRDRLIFIFTFLAEPPPCEIENAEEGDRICSDIYAILHEDEYLLSNFKEINKDFRHQKTLFSAFQDRIDTVNDKIRQLHRGGSSDSWITLELEKIAYNYVPSLHREISWLQMKLKRLGDMKQCKMGLRFLRMSFLWLATWDDTDDEIKLKLSSVITSFQEEGLGYLAPRFRWKIQDFKKKDWLLKKKKKKKDWGKWKEYLGKWENVLNQLLDELQGIIRRSTVETKAWRVETKAWRVDLFDLRIRYKTSTSYQILKFMDSILDNLNDLVSYRASKIIPFMKQIETLEGKLIFLKNLLKLAVDCKHCQELGEFKICVQAFAHDAARLLIFYWTQQGANAISTSDETNSMLSDMLQKIKPTTPEVARLYFGILKSLCTHRSDSHIFGRTAFSFVQLFLEDLVTHLEADDFQILQDNIVFLLSFLNDPPDQNGAELLCSQIDVLFWKDLYSLTPFDDGNEGGFSQKKTSISDFMIKIETINTRIRSSYGKFPDSSLYNFPKVIPPQFLDFLLNKLKSLVDKMNSDRKYVPFVKYKVIKIEEQLASLCPFFVRIFDFQNETWLQAVNAFYLTEYVIMSSISSLFVFDHPFWYHMAYLSKVLDEIQAVKAKLETIILENNAIGFVSEVAETVEDEDETVVGFEDEKEKLICMLTCESKALEIVSIVGMGGSGKTTLAQQILNSLSGKSHFDIVAFYSVSATHNTRKLLLDIISDIKGVDDKRRDMTNDELAQELRQYLSGQRYLVVLDDIWDVSAWKEVNRSFPDHDNGSRIMFTSRSREVAEKCGIKCITHKLRLMSEIESLELFQKKVFRNDISPPYLHEIGKRIAKNCKGLPLAIVVIGRLLARTVKSREWWSEVEQALADYLSKAVGSLELSYKHLPEYLKPCFIYLGAFPEDSLISVKHVIRLWIAEGFVEEENVATRYIHDLIDRSLIIFGERSSSGGIKRFRVHDLVRELCVTKCKDGNFFALNHGISSSSISSHSIQNTYRFSMQTNDDTIAVGSSLSNARTLCNFTGNIISCKTHLRKFRLLQVLDKLDWGEFELESLIHLRYIDVENSRQINSRQTYIPSLISNLGNITYLQLGNEIIVPDIFWRMKSLRHVKLYRCSLRFPDVEEENEAYLSSDQILDKVVSFSTPVLYTQKDVKRLHQRLPALRKLSCYIVKEFPFDFDWELESLKLEMEDEEIDRGSRELYLDAIKLPSTLKKLTFVRTSLRSTTGLSEIAEKLHSLEVLKLEDFGLSESKTLETEDLVFRNLKFFQLVSFSLKEWNASSEAFPCLEKLVIRCDEDLKELPPCLREMPTLKRIVIVGKSSAGVKSSAIRIKEELKDLGTQLELSIPE